MSSDGEQAIQKSALLAAGQAGMIPGALASPQPTLSPYHNAMASLQGIPAGLQAVPGMPGVLGVPMHQPQAGHPAGMHPGLVPQGLFFVIISWWLDSLVFVILVITKQITDKLLLKHIFCSIFEPMHALDSLNNKAILKHLHNENIWMYSMVHKWLYKSDMINCNVVVFYAAGKWMI